MKPLILGRSLARATGLGEADGGLDPLPHRHTGRWTGLNYASSRERDEPDRLPALVSATSRSIGLHVHRRMRRVGRDELVAGSNQRRSLAETLITEKPPNALGCPSENLNRARLAVPKQDVRDLDGA